MWIDAGFSHKHECFAQAFDYSCQHEFSGYLEQVGLLRPISHHRHPAADAFERGPTIAISVLMLAGSWLDETGSKK